MSNSKKSMIKAFKKAISNSFSRKRRHQSLVRRWWNVSEESEVSASPSLALDPSRPVLSTSGHSHTGSNIEVNLDEPTTLQKRRMAERMLCFQDPITGIWGRVPSGSSHSKASTKNKQHRATLLDVKIPTPSLSIPSEHVLSTTVDRSKRSVDIPPRQLSSTVSVRRKSSLFLSRSTSQRTFLTTRSRSRLSRSVSQASTGTKKSACSQNRRRNAAMKALTSITVLVQEMLDKQMVISDDDLEVVTEHVAMLQKVVTELETSIARDSIARRSTFGKNAGGRPLRFASINTKGDGVETSPHPETMDNREWEDIHESEPVIHTGRSEDQPSSATALYPHPLRLSTHASSCAEIDSSAQGSTHESDADQRRQIPMAVRPSQPSSSASIKAYRKVILRSNIIITNDTKIEYPGQNISIYKESPTCRNGE
ncbi:uncharacterized protein SPPG_00156 [Spizellomyces punctatus DAOM BR117]|uniref:Uncharacterized protein n=1 Tax=Spizellomyces punctatus (strain DAOM BR117) TaxID=645134 RepID=A0A0L0HTK1_SPIPD|nr:uncharacterized protein SPPG_00156 [Spizellomyces punctatus DAOM BR117]KND04427.1 hypothetical protein SPPG_00156 [Spizellomyces punctatus DAOM BR117]|eukprot:XP_016612466.1 hypothetical protein SPPG_00156 [Spizellomyces punctatus DAOM BR117]